MVTRGRFDDGVAQAERPSAPTNATIPNRWASARLGRGSGPARARHGPVHANESDTCAAASRNSSKAALTELASNQGSGTSSRHIMKPKSILSR